MRKRGGFTLIELLIVIVVIGILAAMAVPKFGKAREKAYYKTIIADLRTLGTQQELYYTLPANNWQYAPDVSYLIDFAESRGITISITHAAVGGWAATATHAALSAGQECGIFHGTVASPPAYLTSAGVVACTGE